MVSHYRFSYVLRSALLLLAMGAVLALLGWLLGGGTGVLFSLALAGLFALVAPSVSPERLMRAQGARPLHPMEAPGLPEAVGELARRAGLSDVPELYLVPLPIPQAFATLSGGRAAIGISPSLLRSLSPEELLGVLAHELSHLSHRDLWVMRLSETVRRLTRTMSTVGLLMLFFSLPMMWLAGVEVPLSAVVLLVAAPWAVGMLSLALSRSRELDADVGAVGLTSQPLALASALRKIDAMSRPWWATFLAVEVPTWLRTHPSTQERVARLEAMADAGRPLSAPPPRPRRGDKEVIVPVWRRPKRSH